MKMYALLTTRGLPIPDTALCEEHRDSAAGEAIATGNAAQGDEARRQVSGFGWNAWDGNEELVEIVGARATTLRCQICNHGPADTPEHPIPGSEDELENLRTTVRMDGIYIDQQNEKITQLEQQLEEARKATARAWTHVLELILEQRMDDGTPLIVEVLRFDPALATRLRSALGLVGGGR